jgi:hypothetical protein
VKIVDFGIAKATLRARQTAVGVIKGKYYYMSPEQAWGDKLDHRTDIFSNGILLYEMLAGQMLYLEEDLHKLLDMVRKADIETVTALRRDVPPQLERIVMQALSKDRENRYQTASQLASDLERFLHVYSPVFTASKIATWMKDVLQEEPPPLAARDTPDEDLSQRNTRGLTKDQILLSRKEFTDENSVIFNINELARQSPREASDKTQAAQLPLDTSEHTLPDPNPKRAQSKGGQGSKRPPLPPLPGVNPRAQQIANRARNMATQPFGGDADLGTKELDVADLVPAGPGDLAPDLGDEDDKTEISSSPGFLPDGGTTSVNDVGDQTDVNEIGSDPKLQAVGDQTDVNDVGSVTNVRNQPAPSRFDAPIGEETVDGPTLVRDAAPPRGKRKDSSDFSDSGGRSDPTNIDPNPAAAKPAPASGASDRPWESAPSLAAANPKPAISALREPRKSRRTRPAGSASGGVPTIASPVAADPGAGARVAADAGATATAGLAKDASAASTLLSRPARDNADRRSSATRRRPANARTFAPLPGIPNGQTTGVGHKTATSDRARRDPGPLQTVSRQRQSPHAVVGHPRVRGVGGGGNSGQRARPRRQDRGAAIGDRNRVEPRGRDRFGGR